jgi:hypothetical protein
MLVVPTVYYLGFAPPPVRVEPETSEPVAVARGPAPPAKDAELYRTLEEYVRALVDDDRPAVLSLLTSAHREAFGEGSFLILPGAREYYTEIRLADMTHSFPTFTAQLPGWEGVTVAVLVAEYTVYFMRDGVVAQAPRFREELVLREQDGRWLIAMSRRDYLTDDDQGINR